MRERHPTCFRKQTNKQTDCLTSWRCVYKHQRLCSLISEVKQICGTPVRAWGLSFVFVFVFSVFPMLASVPINQPRECNNPKGHFHCCKSLKTCTENSVLHSGRTVTSSSHSRDRQSTCNLACAGLAWPALLAGGGEALTSS